MQVKHTLIEHSKWMCVYDKPFIHWNFVAALAYNKAQAQATYSYIYPIQFTVYT